MSKCLVVGGGLLGLSTAMSLHERGFEVEVLEANSGVGLEASFANGGLLTSAMSDPWNAPGVHKHLAASMFDPASPMKLNLGQIPSLSLWGLRFLRNSSHARHSKAIAANYQLSRYSMGKTREWGDRLNLHYEAASAGTMKIFRTGASVDAPLAIAKKLAAQGMQFQQLDAAGAVALEPQLEPIKAEINSALYFPEDETGDAYLFCKALTDRLKHAGVSVHTDVQVRELVIRKGRVCGLRCDNNEFVADSVVLASGNGTPALLRGTGVSISIAPAKGYSVTFDVKDVETLPKVGVIDDVLHACVVSLGARLRAVGTAEFVGFDKRIEQVRVDNLVNLIKSVFPKIASSLVLSASENWVGFRPLSSDGVPFVGPTPIAGLYLNTGHGHLGWTMAVGSAELLADQIAGSETEISSAPYRVGR